MSPSDHIDWLSEPQLDSPYVVLALAGLFDISGAATAAVEHLASQSKTSHTVASIDPEVFFDFTQNRPTVKIQNGIRELSWPGNHANELTLGKQATPVLAIGGTEPHLRWKTFSSCVREIVQKVGARLVVTLGAMATVVPHTRPLGVIGSATSPALAARLGLATPSYSGPTGLVGPLHVELDLHEIAVISLRVSVPHYISSSPNPEATRSLLARLELITGIETGHRLLDDAANSWRAQVDLALEADPDLAHHVAQLETQIDLAPGVMPTGDSIAAELQAWLRDQHD